MTIYKFHGNPNGNLKGNQDDQGFDVDTNPNNYFVCDGGTVWIAYNVSGNPSGVWNGLVQTIPVPPVGGNYASVFNYEGEAVQMREPEIFPAGDVLVFRKNLPTFTPSNGWSLLYVVTDSNGTEQATVTSVAGTTIYNGWHIIDVDNFMPAAAAGDYVLTGYAINGTERREIYKASLEIVANYQAGTATAPQTTHVQRMIDLLQAKLERLEAYDLSETDVQRNRFIVEQRKETLERLKWYREARVSEIQKARSRSGLMPGNVAMPVFNVG